MSSDVYNIIDEPNPGFCSRIAVNPIWPLLSVMTCGFWFSITWILTNGFALGSPTRKKEVGIAVVGVISLGLIYIGIVALHQSGILHKEAIPYVILLLPLVKLAILYRVMFMQSQTVELFEYFGGRLLNGIPIVAGSYFLGKYVDPWVSNSFFYSILR